MNELLRELQEDMQRERWKALWQQYGRLLVGLSIAIVLGTGAGVGWRHWRDSQHREATSKMLSAIELAKTDKHSESETAFAALEKGVSGSLHSIVVLRHAATLREQGKGEQADALLKAQASKADMDDPYGALLRLQALAAGVDTSAPPKGDFAYTRDELLAWQAVRAGKMQEASAQFLALAKTPEAPASLRERAGLALSVLNPEGGEAPREAQ